MTIIIALLVLCTLVLFHEFGHYIAGRRAGIEVTEFAIGFGPKLVKWNRNGTEFSIRLLPLGGFCKFLGEDEDDSSEGSFNNASIWGRIKTVAAGPIFNIVVALLIAVAMLFMYGNRISAVDSIEPGSSAEQAGLANGDIITSVNGEAVKFAGQASQKLGMAGNENISITVDRGGEELAYTVNKTPIEVEVQYEDGSTAMEVRDLIGVNMKNVRQHNGIFETIWLGVQWVWYLLTEMLAGLGMLVRSLFGGAAVEGGVVGPVGTITLIGEAAASGFENLMMMASLLSVNLGLINLLPLPALDGGRLVFFLIEAVRGKPINPDKEGLVHLIGFAALMVLMVVLTYNDISALLSGGG